MLSDVGSYYGFAKDFSQADDYETGQSQQIVKELSHEIRSGKLVILSGVVGSAKTTMLRRIQETLAQDKEILVSKSLSVEKSQLSLPVLINALFYDLATEKDFKMPTQPEKRERVLRDLIRKRGKPIALFIDDAHDLHAKTLVRLKRLIEVVRDGNGTLSVVLAGHPKLKNDLRRPTMEEIGSRAAMFDLEGFGGDKGQLPQVAADAMSGPKGEDRGGGQDRRRPYRRSAGPAEFQAQYAASVRHLPHGGAYPHRQLSSGHPVQPRGCGERKRRPRLPLRLGGSAPRVRGTPSAPTSKRRAYRFSPAGAGNADAAISR